MALLRHYADGLAAVRPWGPSTRKGVIKLFSFILLLSLLSAGIAIGALPRDHLGPKPAIAAAVADGSFRKQTPKPQWRKLGGTVIIVGVDVWWVWEIAREPALGVTGLIMLAVSWIGVGVIWRHEAAKSRTVRVLLLTYVTVLTAALFCERVHPGLVIACWGSNRRELR